MAPQGAKKVCVARIKFYHIKQFIRKKKQSLPKANFPAGFSLSAKIKRHSNTQEVLIHLEEIAITSVDAKRKKEEILINLHF